MKRLILLLAACGLVACNASGPEQAPGASAGKSDSWQDSNAALIEKLSKEDPEKLAALRAVAARSTRAGFKRITSELVNEPVAAAVFLERYGSESDEEARAALVEALPRTGADFAPALVELLGSERSELVLVEALSSLGRSKADVAIDALRTGFSSESPRVRTAAAQATARHPKGNLLLSEINRSLSDREELVRAAALRTMVHHHRNSAQDAILSGLEDQSPRVRLEALRGVGRANLDDEAQTLIQRLADDGDARVQKRARRMLASRQGRN